MRTERKFDVILCIVSVIAGVAAWFIGKLLYEGLKETVSQTLLVAIEFLLLYFILLITIVVVSILRGTWEDFVLFLDEKWKIILFLVVGGASVFGISALFQFIYGLNSEKVYQGPSSYIFVIDDSGSMQQNDPENLRYSAIEQVLEGMPEDFPYMIYSFSDAVTKLRDMQPVSAGIGEIAANSNGGTAIREALQQVMEDYKNKVWDDQNRRPKVILLTDGYATDTGFFRPIGRILKEYSKANISVSTVGLGMVDTDLMQQIADTTDGTFLQVEDAALLKNAMENAAVQYSEERNLLSVRSKQEKDWLYALMRSAFLTILGIGIGVLMIIASTKEDDACLIAVSSAVKGFLGGLVMEIGTQVVGLSDSVMWLVLWILIAILFSNVDKGLDRGGFHGSQRGRQDDMRHSTSIGSNISRY